MSIEYPPKRPIRFFNTTGPCNPWDHYMLPPEERLVGAQLHRYIRDKLYWVLHAPRQTGKTTFLQNWMRQINSGDEAVSCYVSVERCQGIPESERSMPDLCKAIQDNASFFNLPVPEVKTTAPNSMLTEALANWSALIAPKPLVILFDEVDVLEGESLISFLRQLRNGFAERGTRKFPVSIFLLVRIDKNEYVTAANDGVAPNPDTPFYINKNIKLISKFCKDDISALFNQRTEETGQKITDEALEYVWEQSLGQSWIVNLLFERATMRVLQKDDYSTVTLTHIKEAREQIIQAQETHLVNMEVCLRNTKIKNIIVSILAGKTDFEMNYAVPDVELAMDLGIVLFENGVLSIANPIYREALTRLITFSLQAMIPEPEWQWEKPDGSLDMDALLREFQIFWRENSEMWEQKSNYTEAFPHLLLMAFLQRVLNGGGRIEREYAAGRGRMDLFIEYNTYKYIIEIKLIYEKQSPDTVKSKGLEQTAKYRDSKAPDCPAYLVIFDRRDTAKDIPWDKKIYRQEEAVPGGTVTVLGC